MYDHGRCSSINWFVYRYYFDGQCSRHIKYLEKSFNLDDCDFASNGVNTYFILEPGYQLILEDEADQLVITLSNEIKVVNGTETRVLEERHTEDGELVETSRNYFAVCRPTNHIFYFGEDVDMYEGGKIVNHSGAWLAGVDGATPVPICYRDYRLQLIMRAILSEK